MSLFDTPDGRDPAYHVLPVRPDLEDARAFVLELWSQYRNIADDHFMTEFRNDLYGRIWEMYLACACREAGLEVGRRRSGPDVVIETGFGRIVIEAVAPGGGQHLPWPTGYSIGMRMPSDEELLPRFTAAVQTKSSKFDEDLQKGRLRDDDIRVIAINTIKVPYGRSFEGSVPRPIKAVYPIDECEVVPRDSGRFTVTVLSSRHQISTPNGSPISMCMFYENELSEVSAAIFSQTWPPDRLRPLGHDFILVHNRQALRPLPRGFWPHGHEYWHEGERLCGQIHDSGTS